MQGRRDGLSQLPSDRDWRLSFPGKEVDLAAINERGRLRARFLGWSHKKVDPLTTGLVVAQQLTVLRRLGRPVLALPGKFTVGHKMVDVMVPAGPCEPNCRKVQT